MFDWLRRNQESRAEQGVDQEQALGNSLPTLESCPNGQTPPERGCGVTAGLVGTSAGVAGATAVPAQALHAGVGEPMAAAGVVGGSGEVCEPAGPMDPAQDGESPRDESLGLIGSEAVAPPPLSGRGAARRPGRRLVKAEEIERAPLTGEQRLWILDTWKRSGLPAGDFAPLVGVSKHTLYSWKKQFAEHGPAGLMEQKRGLRQGSRLPELTKRTILLLKEAHPEWGCERISAMLLRGPALPASASAVARVLHEAGYQLEEVATRPHADRVRHFERAKPNQLWSRRAGIHVCAQASEPAGVLGGVAGRSQPVYRQLRSARQSIDRVGVGSSPRGDRVVRRARGDPDGQRGAVRDVARHESVHEGTPEAGDSSDRGGAASSAMDKLPQVRRADDFESDDAHSDGTGGEA